MKTKQKEKWAEISAFVNREGPGGWREMRERMVGDKVREAGRAGHVGLDFHLSEVSGEL